MVLSNGLHGGLAINVVSGALTLELDEVGVFVTAAHGFGVGYEIAKDVETGVEKAFLAVEADR